MSGPKTPPGRPPAPPEDKPDQGKGKSGRVAFDERGNAVWEWSMSTGIFARNVDTKRLKKLQENDLRFADEPEQKPELTLEQPAPKAGSGTFHPPKSTTGGGFDPYNSAGGATRRTVGPKPPAAKPKQKDLRRLSNWIELQKAMGRKDSKD